VDPVPDLLLLIKTGSAGNRTRINHRGGQINDEQNKLVYSNLKTISLLQMDIGRVSTAVTLYVLILDVFYSYHGRENYLY
jgi:hypothetical protein